MRSYRPISIIPVFAKLLERLVYNWIMSFLYAKKILSEAQNGFRKGKSIDTVVQSFIGRIQKALDKWIHTIGIFIYIAKDYDILNHKLFLEKLVYYGVRSSTNLWFRSYLTKAIYWNMSKWLNQYEGKQILVLLRGKKSRCATRFGTRSIAIPSIHKWGCNFSCLPMILMC